MWAVARHTGKGSTRRQAARGVAWTEGQVCRQRCRQVWAADDVASGQARMWAVLMLVVARHIGKRLD